ncbi:hypothetical protein ARMSODRAFT_1027850 [Armillaria solidipes]|uniref:Uncharacterized protein n=1 Tax=Armillaria solidipes TaxID=1076256 RepID=A0A2H3B516_9AGAR|nr:hypothetical protein ARMSODRAFT_1027850 [Armillaria solidipes]
MFMGELDDSAKTLDLCVQYTHWDTVEQMVLSSGYSIVQTHHWHNADQEDNKHATELLLNFDNSLKTVIRTSNTYTRAKTKVRIRGCRGSPIETILLSNTREEALFQLQGVLTEVRLLPVRQETKVRSANDLKQSVRIVSPGDAFFQGAAQAIARFVEFFEETMGQQIIVPASVCSGQAHKLCFYTRLLTPAHAANLEDIVEFPSSYDPSNVLEHLLGDNKFVFTDDNCITFQRLSAASAEQSHPSLKVSPAMFRPGQLVNVGVSFRLFKNADEKLIFLPHLDYISMVSSKGFKVIDSQKYSSNRNIPTRGPAKQKRYLSNLETKVQKQSAVDMVISSLAGQALGDDNSEMDEDK